MQFKIRQNRFNFRRWELQVWTARNIWTFSLRNGFYRFSFKKLERAFEKQITDMRAKAIERLGGEEWLKKVEEYKSRAAENAKTAGMADMDRYSIMLKQYKQFGQCQELKLGFDVKEAMVWRPENDHRLPEEQK